MNDLKPALAQLAKDCGARKLVLFGSRARGDNRPRSDIDLAVFGMPEEQQTRFLCGMSRLRFKYADCVRRENRAAEIRRCVCR